MNYLNGPLNAIFRNKTQLRAISYDLLHRNISEETRRMATGRRNWPATRVRDKQSRRQQPQVSVDWGKHPDPPCLKWHEKRIFWQKSVIQVRPQALITHYTTQLSQLSRWNTELLASKTTSKIVWEKQMTAEHVPELGCFVHASSEQAECITARMEKNIKHTRCWL